jgi:hypothetical protein
MPVFAAVFAVGIAAVSAAALVVVLIAALMAISIKAGFDDSYTGSCFVCHMRHQAKRLSYMRQNKINQKQEKQGLKYWHKGCIRTVNRMHACDECTH